MVAASSGRLVPRARIVKLTTTSEIPIDKANFSTYITAKFDPRISNDRPIKRIVSFLNMLEEPESTSSKPDRSFERIIRK